MKLIAISVRSNFIQQPSVTAFHAAMYHGIAGRKGVRFPSDEPPDWRHETAPLELAINIRSKSKFFVPGYYPVVANEIVNHFSACPAIRFGRVLITKCIDLPWSLDASSQLREDADAIFNDPTYRCHIPKPKDAYTELILRQLSQFKGTPSLAIETELGTPPLHKRVTLRIPESWISDRCAFASGRSFFLGETIFNRISSYVPLEYFVLRECQIGIAKGAGTRKRGQERFS